MRWLATQDEPFEQLASNHQLDGWLSRETRLWARSAPGNTCLSALRQSRGFADPARNNSKGCGTVMRDAPFGFMGLNNAAYAFDLAAATARTTHGRRSASLSSGALAAIIAALAEGKDLRSAAECALSLLQDKPDAREVQHALEHAVELSVAPDWRSRLPRLGEGWVAEEALAIAVLCALATDNSREAIIAAVNHSGDSDSTGAIPGNVAWPRIAVQRVGGASGTTGCDRNPRARLHSHCQKAGRSGGALGALSRLVGAILGE